MFFPEDVCCKFSSSDVLPQLLGCLPRDKVKAVQFLRGGVVRLTFEDVAVRDDVLARGISFQEIQLRVVSAMSEVRVLYVRDLPVEVPDDVVSSLLASFGDVVHVIRPTYKDFPSVCDGNRVVGIVLKQDVPYFVRIADCNCRVWYARQPVQCVICRESGLVSCDCRLSGRCRRCHQRDMWPGCAHKLGDPLVLLLLVLLIMVINLLSLRMMVMVMRTMMLVMMLRLRLLLGLVCLMLCLSLLLRLSFLLCLLKRLRLLKCLCLLKLQDCNN